MGIISMNNTIMIISKRIKLMKMGSMMMIFRMAMMKLMTLLVMMTPTSPSRLSSSPSVMRTPTLSKAPLRSFLSSWPSLLMSISLKQSLYIWICSSEKPPSFWPLPGEGLNVDEDVR